ncbi:Pimeloyl-ACP methyl ester carboxylesterase [Saccharopolyspora kobensis]|uniref:Pimeloyl-ACP methyl ester carboxylesterase n=1 Tax=Saccharopolyspora kobensis TaxID=146035 RepID=A0A1H5XL81_9PSEU|nr:alpha/beta fold hydrolase [Saccharopolyspora kobensis]SEG12534.1 Pimeloyl-ACP methyl ester carboxylesterase [Saccharopolyspora kobensis]SFE41022.1 Pimeloyl-ACP methyl ester carboxylesterase [Saccharopolyspora kobensis]
MPFVKSADQAEIYYETHGSGEPLVLLSGQANTHHWWDNVRADFEADHQVILLDYLGTGQSGKPADAEYSVRRFATDVICVLDELGIARAHVYGTSMGGKVAQWLAIDYADHVGALVLGCTSVGGVHGLRPAPEITRALAQPSAQAARDVLIDLMYSPEWVREHPGPHVTLGGPMPGHARRAHLRASNHHDSWAVLDQITAPTLVLHGTDDVFSPVDNAAILADRIPGAEVHYLAGARHAYFEEKRAEASGAVLGFLAAHPLG